MPTLDILRANHYPVQPWKNGGGETRQIDVMHGESPAAPHVFRLSWATITGPGPFSRFPDTDRTLILLNGGPVTLSTGGKQQLLRPLEPHSFDGAADTRAVDPTKQAEDLNVFCRRGQARASVLVVSLRPGQSHNFVLDAHRHYLFSVDQEVDCTGTGVLQPRDTLRGLRGARETTRAVTASSRSAAKLIWVAITEEAAA